MRTIHSTKATRGIPAVDSLFRIAGTTLLAGLCQVAALLLATSPGVALAQAPAEGMSKVTNDYTVDFLVQGVDPADISNLKQAATWWIQLGDRAEKRSVAYKEALSARRTAKKAEIESLAARVKVAKTTDDDAQKMELEKALKQQKLELEILDSVQDIAKVEGSLADEWRSTGKALQDLASAYEALGEARDKVQQDRKDVLDKATEAGLPAPPPPFASSPYATVLKSYIKTADSLQDLGSKMKSMAKARLGVVDAWKKRLESEPKPKP